MHRLSVIVLGLATGLLACRDAGRASVSRPKPRVDAGAVVLDAGVAVPDAGFVDAGFVDLGVRDGGARPRDGGRPDTGVEPDAGGPSGLSVYALQDPTDPMHPGTDQPVDLFDVVVTAVVPQGSAAGSFWVQDPLGGPHSGIYVYKPTSVSDPFVQVGDRVALRGTLTEYYDVTEIVLDALVSAVPGAPLAPQVVAPDQLANGSPTAESWEGVLVEVQNVLVIDPMPDAPEDYGEWVVTGGLRIDDLMYALEPRPSLGDGFRSIVGVHHHSFENYKVLPRGAADLRR